jgi:superfamily I DNA/RNA helicase
MSIRPKIALSNEFLSHLAKFSSKEQSQLLKWALKFQSNPTGAGMNYEKLPMCKDPRLRSVRINQDWRGIVFQPQSGNLFVLLHADHHDRAYYWAKNRKMTINPETGAMQLVLIEEVVEAEAASQPASRGAFDELQDSELIKLGVPPELVSKVRIVADEESLDEIRERLPVEAYEGLFLAMAGYSVGQILKDREVFMPPKVDVEDYETALETPESQSRFFLIEDDAALEKAIHSPLEQWRIFLHPSQKRLARGDRNGSMRVLGGAGTGKTVVAMHRASWLAEHRTPDGQKVLFTTFTRNLAQDIQDNLEKLCAPTVLRRIEVINLDRWVVRFLKKHRYPQEIIFNYQDSKLAAEAWDSALTLVDPKLGLDSNFYREEWERVIQPQGVRDLGGYRAAKRIGRTGALNRKKRDAIWPVFEEYRNQLAEHSLKEIDDAYRDCAELIAQEDSFGFSYSAIVVDETQDFGTQALKLLRALIPVGSNDLFLVGDGHQRIYSRNRAVLGHCGINIRGRSRKLYLNYRTTDEIRKYAVGLLEGREIDDLDGELDESTRYKSISHGPTPIIESAKDLGEAAQRVQSILQQFADEGSAESPRTCLMTYRQRDRNRLQQLLDQSGVQTYTLEKENSDAGGPSVLCLATMHRSKGLEFDQVIVVVDKAFLDDDPIEDARNLIHVALTRARRKAAMVWIP